MLCDVVLVPTVQEREWVVCVYLFPLVPPSHALTSIPPALGHHRAPSRSPCAIHQLPTSCIFCTWLCIYDNAALSVAAALFYPFLYSWYIQNALDFSYHAPQNSSSLCPLPNSKATSIFQGIYYSSTLLSVLKSVLVFSYCCIKWPQH